MTLLAKGTLVSRWLASASSGIAAIGLMFAPSAAAEPSCPVNYTYDAASRACEPIFSEPVGECDPYSSGGFSGCLGGDFGVRGESTFLAETQWMFPDTSSDELIQLGHGVCRGITDGYSPEDFEDELVRRGVDRVSAIDVVINARTWLC